MKKLFIVLFCLACSSGVAATSRAHFVWVMPTSGGVEVAFSEGPHRGASHLVDRMDAAVATLIRGGDSTAVELSPHEAGEEGWLAAECNAPEFCVAVNCSYGVFDHGPKPLLLEYYAKAIAAASWEDAAQTPTSGQPLEIAPVAGESPAVKLLWQGEPVPAAELIVHGEGDEGEPITTDEAGVARLPEAADGKWAVRTSYTRDEAGTLDGVDYDAEMHVATLALTIDPAAERQSADDALALARENRAVWDDFPGFSAAIRVSIDDAEVVGRATISPYGEVDLEIEEGPARDWVERTLVSLVTHRMPSETIGEGGDFLDLEERHPLGRKVGLFGDSMGSVYRLQDDVVTEVNRKDRGGRFRISVLDVYRNEEGKYLPHAYTATFWDTESGVIRSTTSTLNTWRRVGPFDLPLNHLEVTATSDGSVARQIEFSDHALESSQTNE